jgi:diguanylate cyclase (GGDEF)-like protein
VNRKTTAVLATKSPVLVFLKKFFKNYGAFKPSYFTEPGPFLDHLATSRPSVLIVEDSLIKSVSSAAAKFPYIAVIAGDAKKGVENAMKRRVKSYIYPPYIEKDLLYKLGSAILERRKAETLCREVKDLETVLELTHLLSRTRDPKELLYKIVTKIAEIMPVTRCSIIRADWIRKSAFVVATYEDPEVVGIKLSLKKYPEIVASISSKKPVVIKNIGTDPLMKSVRHIVTPLGIRSILVIPIFFGEEVIGTLFLRTSRAEHAFTAEEIRLLKMIANSSATALYTALLFEQVEDEKTRLEKLSVTDFLTGIYNIRYFYNRIVEEFSRSQRYDLPVSCLMLDVDYFKKINDKYGNKTGDAVLREFAQLLKNYSRKSDVLARYGGEEFIMLLPQTSFEGAVSEADRIRKCVESHTFRSLKNKDRLTVSIGIAVFPHERISTHDDLISLADHALFAAKDKGRNRIATFGE